MTVDDLGVLSVALNVPIPLLLLPVHDEGIDVALTPADATEAVYPWRAWEWMAGGDPLPGHINTEWRSGAEPLWLYERVCDAQRELRKLERAHGERVTEAVDLGDALQQLVDAVFDMQSAGLVADGLIADGWHAEIVARKIEPRPRVSRYAQGGQES